MAGGQTLAVISSERAGNRPGRDRLVRIAILLSFGAAVWFILGDAGRRSSVASIGLSRMAALVAVAAIGSLSISGSWAAIAGRHTGGRVAFIEYVIYQPAKYLPGGVAQSLLQMSHVRVALGSWRRSSAVLIMHSAIVAFAGGLVAMPALLVRFGEVPVTVGVLSTVASGLVLLKLSQRFEVSGAVIPPPAHLFAAVILVATGLGLWGIGYGIAIAAITGGDFQALDVAEFSAGWLAGFVAVPIPAGIGVREAALVGLSTHPSLSVLTASIVVRIAVASAESVLAATALIVARQR